MPGEHEAHLATGPERHQAHHPIALSSQEVVLTSIRVGLVAGESSHVKRCTTHTGALVGVP
jgi:hypothetical protein